MKKRLFFFSLVLVPNSLFPMFRLCVPQMNSASRIRFARTIRNYSSENNNNHNEIFKLKVTRAALTGAQAVPALGVVTFGSTTAYGAYHTINNTLIALENLDFIEASAGLFGGSILTTGVGLLTAGCAFGLGLLQARKHEIKEEIEYLQEENKKLLEKSKASLEKVAPPAQQLITDYELQKLFEKSSYCNTKSETEFKEFIKNFEEEILRSKKK